MLIQKIQNYFESIKFTPLSWLAGISSVIFVRFLLESYSSPTKDPFFFTDISTILHYYIFFIAVALVFVIFVQKFFNNFKNTAFQFVAVFFVSIFIAPILDFIVSKGEGHILAYLVEPITDLPKLFFTYFGSSFKQGITIGIKIEVLIILLSVGSLHYLSEKKFEKSLFSVLILYSIIFFFLSFPSLVAFFGQIGDLQYGPNIYIQKILFQSKTVLNNLPYYLKYSSEQTFLNIAFNFMMAKMFFVISIFSISYLFYLNSRDKFYAVLKNSRLERVAHYFFMVFLGIFIAYIIFGSFHLNWFDYFGVFILLLSIYFSWMFAVFVNDEEDVLIDEVTNKDRPLIQKTLLSSDSKQISKIFLILSLIGAYLSGFGPFFFILCFTALYYMYSAKPTRFKIIPFFSSFIIGLCCLVVVLAGFFFVSPIKDISIFPLKYSIGIILVYFLWSHIRDMKDIDGDKKEGIMTVPVLFGEFWGPKVVGILSSLAFLIIPLFVGYHILFLPAVIFGYLNYKYVTAVPYKEKPIFNNYFLFVIISIVLIFI